MDQRLPDLSDKQLESLHANAVRLSQSGSTLQRRQAEDLLPLIGVQIETRRTARAKTQAAEKLESQRKRSLARESLKKNF
ncbi:MAG TPA: hypothetical protein VEF55_14400 [Candidatus Binatia bacterium]|nr:hypothetical protein [Candidatus Binatia bacterium]